MAEANNKVDLSLSALLVVQILTLFVAIPIGASHPAGHLLLDACHLVFALVCVIVLTRHRALQGALLVAILLLSMGPFLADRLSPEISIGEDVRHEIIALTAFAFNAAVTAIVARHVFGPGRVTAHRVQGAILLYLNVASLFAIAYGLMAAHAPGSIAPTAGGGLPAVAGARLATLTYFSLTTLTTTGFGDLAPISPLARSLASLEAVFGQLFPATLLARIVALRLAHQTEEEALD